jgi:hypothetical protein
MGVGPRLGFSECGRRVVEVGTLYCYIGDCYIGGEAEVASQFLR